MLLLNRDIAVSDQLSAIYEDHAYASLPDFNPILSEDGTDTATESEYDDSTVGHDNKTGEARYQRIPDTCGANCGHFETIGAQQNDHHVKVEIKREPDSPDDKWCAKLGPDSPDDKWCAKMEPGAPDDERSSAKMPFDPPDDERYENMEPDLTDERGAKMELDLPDKRCVKVEPDSSCSPEERCVIVEPVSSDEWCAKMEPVSPDEWCAKIEPVSPDERFAKMEPDSPGEEWCARLQELQDGNIITDSWDYRVSTDSLPLMIKLK